MNAADLRFVVHVGDIGSGSAACSDAWLLELIPGTKLHTVERCSGHDGTWGVKSEYFESSMKIGRPVFRQMAEPQPDWISSDCPIAARHIEQGIDAQPGSKKAGKVHPISLVRRAYGI